MNLFEGTNAPTPESQPFHVNLQAVVELLSKNIYSNPAVYLRELVQNARDAISSRVEGGSITLEDGRITITPTSAENPELIVRDNGLGMMHEEMASLLATVGQSSKRDLFDLPRTDRLGQFGIGLLSCFMITDHIVVETRPIDGGVPSRWVGNSDGTFTIETLSGTAADQVPVGTTVRLTPRPDDQELTTYARVWELAKTFAEFLPIQVEVLGPEGTERFANRTPFFTRNMTTSVGGNLVLKPEETPTELHEWAFERDLEHLMEYGEELIGAKPLAVIGLDIPETGTRGTAFVLPYPPSPGNKHTVRAYLGGLLVGEHVDDLLPDWAFFVRVVLDSTGLTPTASRESFVNDDSLAYTAKKIGEQLRAWIVMHAENDTLGLQHFLSIHDLALRSLAMHDRELAHIVMPYLTFETNQGRMLLGEITAKNLQVRYAATTAEFRQIAGVLPHEQLVINAGYVYETDLMKMLPQAIEGASADAITISDVIAQFNAVLGADAARAKALEEHATSALEGLDCTVEVREFTPEDVSALYVVDPHVLRRMELKRLEESTSGFWGDLMRDMSANTEDVESTLEGGAPAGENSGDAGRAASEPQLATLVLNWRSPLVKMLAGTTDELVTVRTIRLLYVQAMLAGHNPLRPADRTILNESLADMVSLSTNLMKADFSIADFLDDPHGNES